MECKRCGNCDITYFYQGSKGYYCRRCVIFKRLLIDEDIKQEKYKIEDKCLKTAFQFPLTAKQKETIIACYRHLRLGRNVFLKAVCGAGKTEMCVPLILSYLKLKKSVCFAIARKEVVVEIGKRLQKLLPQAKIVSVYGGHNKEIEGDVVVCTTHQLYRYHQYFSLLILDEVDAFPFKDNTLLWQIAKRSCCGQLLFSSATINSDLRNKIKEIDAVIVSLLSRPHGKQMPVPFIKYGFIYWRLVSIMTSQKRQLLIFVSTRKLCHILTFVLSLLFKDVKGVDAYNLEKEKIIEDFRQQKIKYLISTSILERGVTFKDIDVCIICDKQNILDKATLIQMSGRAGRNFNNPYGRVYLLCHFFNRAAIGCRKEIKDANKTLSLLS